MKQMRMDIMYGLAAVAIVRLRRKRRLRRNGRPWAREQGGEQGAFENLLPILRLKELTQYNNFLRMPSDSFDVLLGLVTPLITKKDTSFRPAITPAERLAVTIRFLATGETYKSLSWLFRIGATTIGEFVPEVCEAIYTVLKSKYMKCPGNQMEWRETANLFQSRWQLPNCLGALDGKHVTLRPPIGSGSTFYNYKSTFSIVLMAVVDADYKFMWVDVGCNGRISDGGVFEGCSLQQALDRRSSMFPDSAPCPGDERPPSYYIVADDAFPLQENLMKPYSHKDMIHEHHIFNYRLSRARRVVDNVFGIMANRFRVYFTKIALEPSKVTKIVLAT
ncbi:protein ALP1-like [Gigantopelta aegis]|uniref:protein ALP1-like n=1 Tax=Gigantopelta aegis TaxID=1735272 RepID=UPI001B88E02A|nr:protein ALP1-like [Gigantopelta aegis]